MYADLAFLRVWDSRFKMTDFEKTPAQLTEPGVVEERKSRWNSFLGFVQGRSNDPNTLGKELLQKALEYDEAQLELDAIKVRRKLDWMVIPMVWHQSRVSHYNGEAHAPR